MSVAFRRESDEEHKEPKFELPLPAGPNLVTARGLKLIEARVAALEDELGGATPVERREELERDLRYWRTRKATAQLAPRPEGDVVAFGTRVTIRQNGSERGFQIVGHDEADAGEGRLSFSAPLVRALLGAETGETIDLPGGRGTADILAIEVPSD